MLATTEAISPRYQPVATIGRGGMAEVLLAVMQVGHGLTKLAVLKRTWPELAHDADFVAMFFDEARLALRLGHPNVVQTYEIVEDQERPTIAMEYLHGQALTAVINRLGGPRELSLSLRLRIVADVLSGLEHAHELTDYDGTPLGVVHRDVSPHNVFVTYDGHVKLVDFGVAKTLAGLHQTRPGAIKGKLAYMAPEQLRGHGVDRRADIFAVGVLLWELLAGRRMWQGMAEASIVHHLACGLPLPELPSDAGRPASLDRICKRALAFDPAERFPAAVEMETEIQRVLLGAAESHARNLGQVVSVAFAAARAEREALIDRALDDDDLPTTASNAVAARWTPPAAVNAVTEAPLPLLDVPIHEDLQPAPALGPLDFAPSRRARLLAAAGLVALLGVLVLLLPGRSPATGAASLADPAASAEAVARVPVSAAPAGGAPAPSPPGAVHPSASSLPSPVSAALASPRASVPAPSPLMRRRVRPRFGERRRAATTDGERFDAGLVRAAPVAARPLDESDPFR